jgi:hypothetical protein
MNLRSYTIDGDRNTLRSKGFTVNRRELCSRVKKHGGKIVTHGDIYSYSMDKETHDKMLCELEFVLALPKLVPEPKFYGSEIIKAVSDRVNVKNISHSWVNRKVYAYAENIGDAIRIDDIWNNGKKDDSLFYLSRVCQYSFDSLVSMIVEKIQKDDDRLAHEDQKLNEIFNDSIYNSPHLEDYPNIYEQL